MAKVSSSFKCMVCTESLQFPPNIDIVQFTIMFLQFYKNHDKCEQLEAAFEKSKEQKPAPKGKKK